MAELGGIFLDIFSRLNMASVAKTISQANAEFKRGGEEASRAFSEGGVSGLRIMQDEFRELSRASQVAYDNMYRGLADLQIQEARINDLRARNFRSSTEQMIGAQRDFDAALANSMKLMETANARAAETRAASIMPAPIAGRRGGEDEDERGRGSRVAPVPSGGGGRFGRALGLGAAVGTVIGGIDVVKQSAQLQDALNRLVTVAGEAPGNIKMVQDAIQMIAVKTGYNPQELANVALQGEKRGFRGQDLTRILDVTAQLSRQEKIPLDEALQGIAITAQNYKIPPDQLANVASQLNVAVGRSGTTMQGFVGALPNVEQRAAAAGISREQVWGVLAQMTKSGLSPERASMNEDNLIRSLAGLNGPARDMINTLFTQAGAKGKDGKPLRAADISNNLGNLGITGAVNTIMNQGVLPNLTPNQRVLLPTVFKNEQAKENIDEMMSTFTDPKTLAFANSPLVQGGAMSPMQVTKAAEKAGINPEDISRLRDLAKAEQVQHGFGAQVKGRDSDVQSIAGVLRKAFGTSEASRAAMIIGAGDNPEQSQAQTAGVVKEIGDAHADASGNVEGFTQAMNTTLAQADRAKAAWHDVAITLGDQLSPAVKDAMSGLADFGEWLSQHQGVLDAFAGTMGTIAAIWAGDKLVKGMKNLITPTADLLKFGAGKLGGVMPNTGIIASGGPPTAAATGAGAGELSTGVVTGAKEGAPLLSEGVMAGARAAVPVLTEGVTGGGRGAGTAIAGEMTAGGARAGAEIGGAMTKAGAIAADEIGAAGRGIGAGMQGMIGQLGALAAGMEVPRANKFVQDNAKQNAWWTPRGMQPGVPWYDDPIGHGIGGLMNMQNWLASQAGLAPPGNAHGGIAGYKRGGKTADPNGQPLLGQPDTGGDSLLGMLPGGMPIGLRGGEGILTPETTRRLGGKEGIDALNSGENPWANPVKVGTTFFGSFAKGVAKYSKWGKYLTAASQSIDSLTGEGGKADGEHGGTSAMQHLINMGIDPSTLSPESLAALTSYYHTGIRGETGMESGAWPTSSEGAPKDKAGIEAAVRQAYTEAGFDPSQWRDLTHIMTRESGWNPTARNPKSGAFGLGQFLGHEGDKYGAMGAYSGDPYREAQAMMTYIKDNYGSPAGAWKHWQGAGSYSRGGIVGYSGGGVLGGGQVPLDPPPPAPGPAPAPPPPSTAKGPLGDILSGKNPQYQPKPPPLPPPPTGGGGPMDGDHGLKPPGIGQGEQRQQLFAAPGTAPGTYPKSVGDRGIDENTSRQGGQGNSSKGFGVQGGVLGMAEGAATMAANAFAPGAGAASNMAFQLMNRAIGYGGQLVGIGLSGLMETFLPNNSPLADPTNNLLGKAALGIAGAHKSPTNSAGNSAMQLQPKEGLDPGAQGGGAKQVLPMVHMDHPTINNHAGSDGDDMHRQIKNAMFGLPDVGGH